MSKSERIYTSYIEPLDESDSPWKYNLGATVYFKDPDQGISSGWYTIIERYAGGYTLSNSYYNIEANEQDLSL